MRQPKTTPRFHSDSLEPRTLLSAALVSDLWPGAEGGLLDTEIVDVSGTLFFRAQSGPGEGRLWKLDGTSLEPVDVAPSIRDPRSLTAHARWVYLAAKDVLGTIRLYKSDGTVAGTSVMMDRDPGGTFVVHDGDVYFEAGSNSPHTTQFWRSDGTPSGTVQLTQFTVGYDPWVYPNVEDARVIGGNVYFITLTDRNWQLHVTDGTTAGTFPLDSMNGDGLSLTDVNGIAYYSNGHGQLAKTDGTRAGTVQVGNWMPGSDPPDGIEGMTCVGNRVFYAHHHWEYDPVLWVSDGTTAGTRMVMEFADIRSYEPWAVIGNTAYFFADDGSHGTELWKSDGSVAGTVMVRDIRPGLAGDRGHVFSHAGVVYFTYDDGAHGVELWQTDGSAAGTRIVQDINSGIASSNPSQFTISNGTLFFASDDGIHGRELWKVTPEAAPPFATLVAGRLKINGTATADTITLLRTASTIDATLNGQTLSFSRTAVKQVLVESGNGNDIIDCSTLAIPVSVNAGTGNDRVSGGNSADFLRGEGGKDTVYGGRGDDRIEGNAGNDYLIGGEGHDAIWAGTGNDRIEGNAGKDTLYGQAGNDALFGGSGNDRLDGGGGNDNLSGQAGADRMLGGDGRDRFFARDNIRDILDGGGGRDLAQVDLLDETAAIEQPLI